MIGRRWLALTVAACAAALWAASPAMAFNRFGSRTLSPGMSGHDVMWLQRNLTKVGFSTPVTSRFNGRTEHEVELFQRFYKISADGIVGPQTFREILVALHGVTTGADATTTKSGKTVSPTSVAAPTALSADDSGGSGFVPSPTDAPVEQATLNSQGLAVAPEDAPTVIREVIAAANRIAFKPYIYGGGHASFNSPGYDCSGSVSYALHGGGLLASPLDSEEFISYGDPGAGRWISIWTEGSYHVYMQVAGLWFDTAAQSSANGEDRWSTTRISPAAGFQELHPAGW